MGLAAFAQGPNADADNPVKKLSLEELGNIEVTTASKAPEEARKIAAAVFVITHDDIERSGATTIPEALRLAPGVEVARIDGNKWSIGIRGFGSRLSRSVLVLIDGRTVYTTLFAGTYWEVQDTVMDDIDRIEVIRGPGGTIWGPNAVDGVINVITKDSKDTQGTQASVGGGNVEQGFVNLRTGAGNGQGLTYRVYGKGYNRSGEFDGNGQNFDGWRAGQAGFRMDWQKNDHDTFTLQGDMYDEAAGESVVATSYTAPFSQTINNDARLSGGNIMAHWKRQLDNGKDFQLQLYYDRTNRHESNFGDIRNTFDADFIERIPLPARQRLSVGAGARFSDGDELEVVTGLTFDPANNTDQLLTAFIQDEIELVPHKLSVIAGTKLLHTNFTGVDLEPSVRLLWTPSEKQTIWTSFTRAVRTPADVERDFFLSGFQGLAPGGIPFFARFNANRNFVSEILKGYEAGYRRLIRPNFYIDVAGFFNQYDHLFSEEITGAPFLEDQPPPANDNIAAPPHLLLPAQFGNSLTGTTTGGEIAPEWRPASFWRLRGSYSFLVMHIEKTANSLDIGSGPGIQGSSPQHQVFMQSGFDISKALTLDLFYRYVSALPGQGVRAYSSADTTVGWRMNEHVRFSVVGQNLLQPHHAEDGGDPNGLVQIKRSVYAKITWTR
ncbi:MAG TPA: TonB-dependent receptor [Candidatus Angelobacter sp.]|nr:TonB-dependent receptor [Candidatus Angelobacter sp.]